MIVVAGCPVPDGCRVYPHDHGLSHHVTAGNNLVPSHTLVHRLASHDASTRPIAAGILIFNTHHAVEVTCNRFVNECIFVVVVPVPTATADKIEVLVVAHRHRIVVVIGRCLIPAGGQDSILIII